MHPETITLPEGTMLHRRYRINNSISKGGFGNVYLADDQESTTKVAIKEAFYSDNETREQFDFEAQVLMHVDHKNVVRGYATFEENGRFYLVMQFIDGLNLEELQVEYFKTSRHPIPEPLVLSLMATVSSATQALHDKRILHRDIKPANIKLNRLGDPILLDLGLAKLYQSPESQTLIAAQAYTPGYAPPEQCLEDGKTTERTDIYALGATAYYALTGRQPWESLRRLTELNLGNADLPPPSAWLPSISPATDAVIMHAMALDETKRYQNPTNFQKALDGSARLLALPEHERLPIMCPDCAVPNSAKDDFCTNCGHSLHPATNPVPDLLVQQAYNATQPVVAPPTLHTIEIKSPIKQLPNVVLHEPAHGTSKIDLSALPDRARPRRLVPHKPPISMWANATLILGALSFIPVIGWLLALITIPLGLNTRGVIKRSMGSRRGGGRATAGVLLAILALCSAVFIIYLAIRGF